MKKYLIILVYGLLSILPTTSYSQTPEKPLNRNKIELLLYDYTVTQNRSNGASYSYSTRVPQLRFNDGPEVEFKPSIILPYLEECPKATKQVELFQQERKKSRQNRWIGALAGSGIVLAGLVTAVSTDPGLDDGGPVIFGVGFGLGLGTIIYGNIKANKHKEEALRHMKNSVSAYNRDCYQPLPAGVTVQPSLSDTLPLPKPSLKGSGVQEGVQPTLLYEILKNDPEGYRFASGGLIIGDVDGTNAHGFTYRSGLSARLHTNRFFADASFKLALVDNLTGYSYGGTNKFNQTPLLEPVDYQRAHEWSVTGGVEIFGKEKEVEESFDLGTRRVGGMPLTGKAWIPSKKWISWSLRAGITGYRSVLFEESGLHLSSSAEPVTEVINPYTGETQTFYFDDMDYSMAMLRSASLSLGISRRGIRSLDINVQNTPYRGKKRLSFVTDWYADLLYAPKAKLGNMIYYYEVLHSFSDPSLPESFSYEVSPDLTVLKKIGWRFGFRMFGTKGWEMQVEVGQRPGFPQSSLYAAGTAVYSWGKEF